MTPYYYNQNDSQTGQKSNSYQSPPPYWQQDYIHPPLPQHRVVGEYEAPSFKQAWLMFFKRFGDFNGRSRRSEYWKAVVINLVMMIALFLLAYVIGAGIQLVSGESFYEPHLNIAGLSAMGLFCVAAIIPYISITVRRMHDVGINGLWLLLALVPIVGQLLSLGLIILYCAEGKPEPNQWGWSPKYKVEKI